MQDAISDNSQPGTGEKPANEPITLEELAKKITDAIQKPSVCKHCGKPTGQRIVARSMCDRKTNEVIIAVSLHEVCNIFREKNIVYKMYVQAGSQLFFRFDAPGAV